MGVGRLKHGEHLPDLPEIGAMAMGWQSYHIYHEKASRKIPQMYNHDQEDNVQGK